MHIVEQLIAERAQKLMAQKRLFRMFKPLLYRMLAYDSAVALADVIEDKTGNEAFELVTNQVKPQTTVLGLENIPESGKCIIISNHPTGLADGMAVYKAIKHRRPDHLYLANADALRVIPKGDDIIIPVEWVMDKRSVSKTRQTLTETRKVLSHERCVVIFPSGRLATLSLTGLVEAPWESSAAMLAKKYNAPVIPLHIKARNSWLYYVFSKLNNELRDITLFHELLNKKGQTFVLTFGAPISPDTLPKNADEATDLIRNIVMGLGSSYSSSVPNEIAS